MRSLYAIYRKEMGHYFVSPIAYVLVGLFLFLSGFFFDLYVNAANDQAPDAPTWVLRAFLGFLALVFRIVLSGYLGALLFGGSLLALGSFLSSLTENQIIAAALTFAAFLVLWAIDFGTRGASGPAGQVLQYLSVINHYDDFTRGIIDTAGVTYYLSFIILFIFLTVRSVDSMRWRRA